MKYVQIRRRRSGFVINNFEHVSHLALLFIVSIVNFEQANADWDFGNGSAHKNLFRVRKKDPPTVPMDVVPLFLPLILN